MYFLKDADFNIGNIKMQEMTVPISDDTGKSEKIPLLRCTHGGPDNTRFRN